MSTRDIKTVYYSQGQVVKTTRAMDANRAVATAVLHMQILHYDANVCEVFDDNTGELHASMRYTKAGALVISYMRDPRQFETKYAVSYLLGN